MQAHVPAAVGPAGSEIVVCGERIEIGAPVVLWTQVPGYDAYRTLPRPKSGDTEHGMRYQPGRVRKTSAAMDGEASAVTVLVEPGSTDRARLAEVVDQFVLHYDACGTSRGCFRVLHEERGLSVHFLLDLDGTIYQTMDLREQAFHATKANARSIGIEIANVGAYPTRASAEPTPLDTWYRRDAAGPYVEIPARLEGGGLRTPGFVARPARGERVVGVVQGAELAQYDFTSEQYRSLTKLTAALCRTFPRLAADAPRDANGAVASAALSPAEFERFGGIVGHFHVQTNKHDPGPAFDWDRFLEDVRAEMAAP